jgi:hypothetical protein
MRGKLFKIVPLGAALFCLGSFLLAAGCGSGGSRFRYLQAATAPQGNVDLNVDGKTISTNVGYGVAGSYQSTSSGSHQFEVFLTGTTTNPFFNGSAPVNKGDNTVITMGTFSTMSMSVFQDDNTVPTSGDVKLKFIHAAPTAGAVDVYIITPNSGIGGLAPQLSGLQYQKNAGPLNITAGGYEVVMTQAGTQNPIQGLDIQYTWTAGQVRTIVILDSSTGGAPYNQLVLTDAN